VIRRRNFLVDQDKRSSLPQIVRSPIRIYWLTYKKTLKVACFIFFRHTTADLAVPEVMFANVFVGNSRSLASIIFAVDISRLPMLQSFSQRVAEFEAEYADKTC